MMIQEKDLCRLVCEEVNVKEFIQFFRFEDMDLALVYTLLTDMFSIRKVSYQD